jgi:hypothetical protein
MFWSRSLAKQKRKRVVFIGSVKFAFWISKKIPGNDLL